MPAGKGYFKRESKDGKFSPKIGKALNDKIDNICWALNMRKTDWVMSNLEECADRDIERIRKAIGGRNNG